MGTGAYRITLTSTEESGEKIQTIEHFTLYDLDDKLVPVNKTLFTVNEKTTLEPYEDAVFYAGTSEENLNVLFEIERDGKIDTQNWMDVKGFQKMLFKIMEEDRGNVHYHLTYVKNNRFQQETQTITVPFTNKQLNIEYQTFRDKLLPGQDEEWRLKITGKNKEKVAAEMVAAMYDASLDQFARNAWYLNLYNSSYPRRTLSATTFRSVSSEPFYQITEGVNETGEYRNYRNLNWFGFTFFEARPYPVMARSAAPMARMEDAAMAPPPPPSGAMQVK